MSQRSSQSQRTGLFLMVFSHPGWGCGNFSVSFKQMAHQRQCMYVNAFRRTWSPRILKPIWRGLKISNHHARCAFCSMRMIGWRHVLYGYRYRVRVAVVDLDKPPAWWQGASARSHLTAHDARQLAGTTGRATPDLQCSAEAKFSQLQCLNFVRHTPSVSGHTRPPHNNFPITVVTEFICWMLADFPACREERVYAM